MTTSAILSACFFSLLGLFLTYRGLTKEQNKAFKYADLIIGPLCFLPNFFISANASQLKNFIEENPYIDVYLVWYVAEQKKLEDIYHNHHAEQEQKRATIRNFNKEF